MKQTIVAAKLNQDYGDTVPSKPQNIGIPVGNEIPAGGTLRKQELSGAGLVAEGMHFIMACALIKSMGLLLFFQ